METPESPEPSPSPLDKPRPLLVAGLLVAGAYVAWRVFSQAQSAQEPRVIAAHVLNMLAIVALATRWAKPEWKKAAMVVALLSALLAFVVGRQVG
ncbi:MAG: hypothetical protein IT381_11250 [Deltaproteobacteria bacterium]|nr:hypothetical protein [Deltaproteobacteria bacterium]